jgi:hypothetical protein
MEWLNDPWVIGIGGGILSGLIVTGVSRWIFSGRDRKEHLSKVGSANREVVYAIRQGIPEDRVPTREIVEALISSTARKYGLPSSDLNQPQDVASDLVKEVMDSSFISAEKKEQYCSALLNKLTPAASDSAEVARDKLAVRTITDEQRSRLLWMMSATLGLTAAGMSAVMAVFLREADPVVPQTTIVLLPVAVALSASVIAMLLAQVRRYRRQAEQANRLSRQLMLENREIFPDFRRVLSAARHTKPERKDIADS